MALTLLIIAIIVSVITIFYFKTKKPVALIKQPESSIIEQPKEEKKIINYTADGREK
ncbi:MAG: hypothetical protein Q7T34_00325 [Candidatus Parcubacteria bacterium]|nr:hypothetical protein [Candidatus Parcubacteria bacterium]